jgi:hypothetical protein
MSAPSTSTLPTATVPLNAPDSGAMPLLGDFPADALPPGLDFAALLAEGIGYAQAQSSDSWTDYNEHDPGLTILEQLCYALTDLGLRGQYRIEDLFADSSGRIAPDTLFTGDRILSSAPLTPNDYRKLVYDRIDGLKNFWLEPVEGGLPGLYRGLIEKYEWGSDKQLISQVSKLMRVHRLLGEDIVGVEILRQQELPLSGLIQLQPGYDADEVMGEVLFKLDLKLVPGPTPQAIDLRIAAGEPFDAIYQGPLLEYGSIDDTDLVARPRSVGLQRIASIVQSVPGVRLLAELRFTDGSGDTLKLADDSVPFIAVPDDGASWPFQVVDAAGTPATLNPDRVRRYFLKSRADARQRESAVKLSTASLDYLQLPSGRNLDIERYQSIQHQFPVTYGLSRYGIPDDFHWQAAGAEAVFAQPGSAAGSRRAAQVKQLRAYLLLFEQVLANGFSQLANARWLFALHPPQPESYFSQPLVKQPPQPNDPPQAQDVLRDLRAEDTEAEEEQYWRHIVCVYRQRRVMALRSVRIVGEARARRLMHSIVQRSMHAEHYRITHWRSGEFACVLLDAQGELIAYGVERFATLAEARHEVHKLAAQMRRAHGEHRVGHYVRLRRQGAVGMRVIGRRGQAVLSAYWPCPLAERTARVDEVLHFGRHHRHYAYRRWRGGGWSFVLLNQSGEQIAEGLLRCASEEESRHEARGVAHLIEHIGVDPLAYQRHVQLLPDQDERQPPQETVPQSYARHLKALMARFDRYPERRNRFLDHLLARFGEKFDDALLQDFDPRPANQEGFLLELASWKRSFLASYPLSSTRRANGFDYGRQIAQAMPFGSGLEHRLYSLLGLGGAHYFARYPMSRRPLTATPPSYRVSSQEAADQAWESGLFRFEHNDPDILGLLLKYGTDQARYLIAESADERAWGLYFVYPDLQARLVLADGDPARLLAHRDSLIAWLQRSGGGWDNVYAGEGLYVLEHILLRPLAAEAGLEHGEHADFYRSRISVLLPAWPQRFRNPRFRQYVEQLVADNCPAHLGVDCHWLEFDHMRQFEELYAAWAAEKRRHTRHPRSGPQRLDRRSHQLRSFLLQMPHRDLP